MSADFIWVDNDLRLATLCEQWSKETLIAVDTEFLRTDTFYPKVGLLQIADSKGIYLLDPLAIKDLKPLQSLWQQQSVVKVLHSASEDLDLFQYYLGVLPTPLFDTQLAAAFAGYGYSLGYAALVKILCDVDIPKGETRSNWLQRPLRAEQLEYAALDVIYLEQIYRRLYEELRQQQRLSWLQEDCVILLTKHQPVSSFECYYQQITLAYKLSNRSLNVLQALCCWREQEIRKQDVPRNHLLSNQALVDLATYLPQQLSQLKITEHVSFAVVKKYGETIVDIVQKALNSQALLPAPAKPLRSSQRQKIKRLRQALEKIAASQQLPVELLANKKSLDTLLFTFLNNKPLPTEDPMLKGWRQEVVVNPLLQLMQTQFF